MHKIFKRKTQSEIKNLRDSYKQYLKKLVNDDRRTKNQIFEMEKDWAELRINKLEEILNEF